jgi:hypothetical protein
MESTGLAIVSSECTNCRRFVEALGKVENHGLIVADYSSLMPEQKKSISAVPTVILNSGKKLVGTSAFTWLTETFYANMEPDAFQGFDNCELSYSDINDSVGYCTFQTNYAEL